MNHIDTYEWVGLVIVLAALVGGIVARAWYLKGKDVGVEKGYKIAIGLLPSDCVPLGLVLTAGATYRTEAAIPAEGGAQVLILRRMDGGGESIARAYCTTDTPPHTFVVLADGGFLGCSLSAT